MRKFKQSFSAKALAWVLAVAITVTMTPMPFAAFADPGAGTQKAGEAIESQVSNDAKNAIHAYVGIQVGGDLNMKLEGDALNQQFKPIAGVRAYFQWFENGGYA